MDPILPTKIIPPQLNKILPRPRLLETLAKFREYRLFLITAGAGFGKTSLLVDFALKTNSKLAWYTLDENDRDPAVFCRYLLSAVRRLYPLFGQSFENFLEQNCKELHLEPVLNRVVDEFITELVNLQTDTFQDFQTTLIVLDDFQFAESKSVTQIIQRLVSWLPANIHIIIASRVPPEGLTITKFLAKQMLGVLDQSKLAFQKIELADLLLKNYGLEDTVLVNHLLTFSDGWITAVILALLNYKEPNCQESFLSEKSYGKSPEISWPGFNAENIFNYLALEVFENQTTELKEFLVKTSVFPLLNPGLCDQLMELSAQASSQEQREYLKGDSEHFLRQLEGKNLFTSRLSSPTGNLYQYHSLFRSFLLLRLKEDPKNYRAVQLLAARVQSQAGNFTDTVQHFIAASEIGLAAQVLNEIAEQLYEAGRTVTLTNLLDSIPFEELNNLPHLLTNKARLLVEQADHAGALQAYSQAELLFIKEAKPQFAARNRVRQAEIFLRTGRQNTAIKYCKDVLEEAELLMQTREGQLSIASAKLVLGMVAIEEVKIEQAENLLEEASAIFKNLDDKYRLALIDNFLGNLYQNEGQFLKSNRYFEKSLAEFNKLGNPSREAYCRVSMANNFYKQGHYKQAEELLEASLTLCENLKDNYLHLFVLANLSNIYRDTGRYSQANDSYNRALGLARESQVRKMELSVLNDLTTNLILSGIMVKARELVQVCLDLACEYELPDRTGFSYFNQSLLDYEANSLKHALTAVDKAISIFISGQKKPEQARAVLAQALIYMAMGEPRKSIEAFRRSIEISNGLSFTPYLPFEMNRAESLFRFAARKKMSPSVENFLRQQGYLSVPPNTGTREPYAKIDDEKTADETLPPPIPFRSILRNPTNAKQFADWGTGIVENTLQLFALDEGKVFKGKTEIGQWRTTKVYEALFFLAEKGNCTRDELFEALWPEENSENARHLVGTTTYHLRRTLAPLVDLKYNFGRYQLEGPIFYDAALFKSEINRAYTNLKLNSTGLIAALTLYKKDFLVNTYTNWSQDFQKLYQKLYLQGLEKLISFYLQENETKSALSYLYQLLERDSYNEKAHQQVIEILLKEGQRSAALRQYDACLKALEELNLRPSLETENLKQRLA